MNMSLWSRRVGGIALVLIGGVAAMADQPPGRAAFMRKKLDFSKEILEGLTRENYDQVAEAALALRRLSEAAEWEVATIPNADQYVADTTRFQQLCDDLVAKARGKDLDGATTAANRITVSCVSCHKYVRAAHR
jgi:cytochrome c556